MQIIHVYWRDIPAQVIVKHNRVRGRAALNSKFQKAIDRTAMRVGKGSSAAYMEEWRRETVSLSKTALSKIALSKTATMTVDDLTAIAEAEVEAITFRYTDADLKDLIAQGGLAESSVEKC